MIKILQALISSFFVPFLEALLAVITNNKAAAIKDEIVRIAKNTEWSNDEKRNYAFNQLKSFFQNLNLPKKDSWIFFVIEVAVQLLKNRRIL